MKESLNFKAINHFSVSQCHIVSHLIKNNDEDNNKRDN